MARRSKEDDRMNGTSKLADFRLDTTTPLRPGDAVCAIITVEGQYLLQLRDNIAGIFFPACWGCFGGGVEPGETNAKALMRELKEELDLTVDPAECRSFTRMDFDMSFAGLKGFWRETFELTLPPSRLEGLRVMEGAAMRLFTADEILAGPEMLTPYDAFALWLHINRSRLIG
jgi:8-oxo-dGTP pyrophosphatase MutT (NUDIX family)